MYYFFNLSISVGHRNICRWELLASAFCRLYLSVISVEVCNLVNCRLSKWKARNSLTSELWLIVLQVTSYFIFSVM